MTSDRASRSSIHVVDETVARLPPAVAVSGRLEEVGAHAENGSEAWAVH